jgi:hypothetical protein
VNGRLSTSGIVSVAAGAVLLGASFLLVFESDSAWSSGSFPLLTLPAILGVVMAAQVLVSAFANGVKLPDRVLEFSWTQVHVALGIWAALMMVCFLVGEAGVSARGASISPSKGIGFWLMLLGAIGLAVGAVMRTQERSASPM